jgi:hypothetical protein
MPPSTPPISYDSVEPVPDAAPIPPTPTMPSIRWIVQYREEQRKKDILLRPWEKSLEDYCECI